MDLSKFTKAISIHKNIEYLKKLQEFLSKEVFNAQDFANTFNYLYRYSYDTDFKDCMDVLFKSLLDKANSDFEKL